MVVDAGELKVSVAKPAAWARRLTITVPADWIARERQGATERLARRVRLPGFRKGKVPAHVIEKRFGRAIDADTLEKVVNDAYREAVRREGLDPITDAAVGDVNYSAGTDLTFNVDVEVRPEIELNRLGGFRVPRPVPVVEDGHVDEMLERVRDQQAVLKPLAADVAPETGDVVAVEIAEIGEDGVVGASHDRQITLGQGEVVPSIEEAILTLRPGQDGEFTVDLSAGRSDAPATPEPHRLRVKLLDAARPDRPPLDDDLARTAGDFETIEDLRARIREDLQREAERDAERTVRANLIQNVIDANPFEVPESMVENYLDRLIQAPEGVDQAQDNQLRASARPIAERALQRMLVVNRVAELESLRATPDEVNARLALIAERIERPEAQVRAQLRDGGRLQEIEAEITENKVVEYLKSLSTIE
ncbi:MAG: trigger factor [Longimicrobiales bacterium]